MLGVPDAYELPSAPGNGYLKVESDMTRFKAAYVSGAVTERGSGKGNDDSERVSAAHLRPAIAPFGPAFIPPSFESADGSAEAAEAAAAASSSASPGSHADAAETLLDVIVAQLAGHGLPAHQIWLPPLDEPPTLDGLMPPLSVGQRGLTTVRTEGHASLCAVMGIVDKPYEQRRDPLWVDLSGGAGHAAIVGAPRTGKSTAVRTLLTSLALLHTPEEVQFYILDFAGGTLSSMDGLPHVGGPRPGCRATGCAAPSPRSGRCWSSGSGRSPTRASTRSPRTAVVLPPVRSAATASATCSWSSTGGSPCGRTSRSWRA